jgi:hypothetical protein
MRCRGKLPISDFVFLFLAFLPFLSGLSETNGRRVRGMWRSRQGRRLRRGGHGEVGTAGWGRTLFLLALNISSLCSRTGLRGGRMSLGLRGVISRLGVS